MDNQILPIVEDVSWIGVLDADLRTFDVIMETEDGTTYNSYFINASKKAVVEVVKSRFFPIFEEKLRKLCNPEELEYIIIDHTEPDHVGGLEQLLDIAPNAVVVGSNSAIKFLQDQVSHQFDYQIVKDGDCIDLGNKALQIISAPNLHWPDSIYSYLEEDQILFTCDSFGAHFCHPAMYNHLVGDYSKAFQYYFDVILKPFSSFFLKAIDKISNLTIKAICTGHGPLLTHEPEKVIEKTKRLCEATVAEFPEPLRVLVAYVSAYGFTKCIAEQIAEGLKEVEGIKVDLCDLEVTDDAEIGKKIAKASGYLLGSPTINQNMLPQLYALFSMMTPLRERCKLAGCFGSYGWSGEARNNLISNIENLKLNYFGENMFLRFKPQETDKEKIKDYGKRFGEAMKICYKK